ncbi:MAG: histidine kinase dimerization/phospho-acceptor domain-containing protein [Clostridia bacterium]|nr:histidine kinase dimerization/phospho-acceptor domain-containing protein [Clostridia bacterium]MDD4375232.1 histidine kinase dimerization/phospho-acceptor domain-containing protein [Clostridia bacterium]
MFKSMKWNIVLLATSLVLISSLVTMLLVSYRHIGKPEFAFDTLIVLTIGVLLLVSIMISSMISRNVSYPMKRMQKIMQNLIAGKVNNISRKVLLEETKAKEIEEFVGTFNEMIEMITKKNFYLDSQESKTEIILEHMADGVIAYSVNKQVIHINKSAIKLMGLTEKEDTYDKVMKKVGIRIDFEKIMYLPNYKRMEQQIKINESEINMVFVPYHSDKLMPMGVIMIAKNITETIKLDNMRKEFVANVSHELKTPLTSIKGYSETILEGGLSDSEKEKFIKVINNEANRMDRLVADLLKLSRFDYKMNKFNSAKFNLDDLAKEIVEKLSFVAEQKRHALKCIVNMVPAPIYGDKDSIEQVIVNIVSNSIKYTKDGGEIIVYVGSIPGKAYIKVVDNGIGIPKKDLDRIFERFYRVDKARTRGMGGTGLRIINCKRNY